VRAVRFDRPALALTLLLAALAASSASAQEATDDPLRTLLAQRGLVAADTVAATLAAPRDMAGDLVLTAMNFLDVRYRRGGNSADEVFDCSGFTRHVVSSVLGLQLPRRSAEQAQQAGLPAVERQALQPGDLVFFNTLKRAFSHVGIYIGDGRFIHSPRSGQSVRVEEMDSPYWSRRFNGARRVAGS
jgi:cell wall-associated NlpC family hydrolase